VSKRVSMTPVEQTISLLEYDEEGTTTVTFRQALRGAVEAIAAMYAKSTMEWDDNSGGRVRQETEVNQRAVETKMVSLTLAESNLLWDDDTPVFKFSKRGAFSQLSSEAEFLAAWERLPAELAEEIFTACLTVNPQWDLARQRGKA